MHVVRIGAYRLVRRMGGAGDAREVYLAIAEGPSGFERAVLLKRQPASTADDPEHADRLLREANVHTRLTHPAIVQLFDLFERDGWVVLVREYVHGLSLAELLHELRRRRARLPDPASLFLIARIFDALAAAHAARHPLTGEYAPVIHRDVTPDNVLVPWDGYAKLADFGMAKVLGRANDTAVGVIKGSLGYLAPEQVLGDPVTLRTDVYGAALVAREVLGGHEAFPRDGLPELEWLETMARPRFVPLDVLRPDLPGPVLDAIRIALEPDPDRRAVSAAAVVELLREVCDLERGRRVLVDVLAKIREDRRRAPREDDATPASLDRAESTLPSTPPRGLPSSRKLVIATEAVAPAAVALTAHPTPGPTVAPVLVARRLSHDTIRTNRRPPRPRGLIAGTAAAALVAMLAGYSTTRRWLRAPPAPDAPAVAKPTPTAKPSLAPADVAPPVTASAVPSPKVPASEPIAPPAGSAHPAPIAPPGRGWIRTPIAAKGHRVFVDGRFACAAGESILVRCGPHQVKIGSAGKKQPIDVPCGGEIAVAPKW